MSSLSTPSSPVRADPPGSAGLKRLWLLAAAGLGVALLAFGLVYWLQTRSTRTLLRAPEGELAWLRREFSLSDDQFARVASLHKEYRPTCGALCGRIAEQNGKLQAAVMATNRVTPEIERLVAETGRVRDECRAAMLTHLYQVASVYPSLFALHAMPPEAGRRYLDLMLQATCVVENARTVEAVHADGSAPGGGHHGH